MLRVRLTSLRPVLLFSALFAIPSLGQDNPGGIEEVPGPGTLDFKRDIQPIFSRHCWHCHGSGEAGGGLRLDRRELALQGSDSGPVIIPGDSSVSRLIQVVTGTGGLLMPLQGDPCPQSRSVSFGPGLIREPPGHPMKRTRAVIHSQARAAIGRFKRSGIPPHPSRVTVTGCETQSTPLCSKPWRARDCSLHIRLPGQL